MNFHANPASHRILAAILIQSLLCGPAGADCITQSAVDNGSITKLSHDLQTLKEQSRELHLSNEEVAVSERPRRPMSYDEQNLTYLEACAGSQYTPKENEKAVANGKGNPWGHMAFFLKGVCADKSSKDYPKLMVCPQVQQKFDAIKRDVINQILLKGLVFDQTKDIAIGDSEGVAISVSRRHTNRHWTAVPGKDMFLNGNVLDSSDLTETAVEGAINRAEKTGAYDGVTLDKDTLKERRHDDQGHDETITHLAARKDLGLGYGLNFGRNVSCVKVPLSEADMTKVIGKLNSLNKDAANGSYTYDFLNGNCAELLKLLLQGISVELPQDKKGAGDVAVSGLGKVLSPLWAVTGARKMQKLPDEVKNRVIPANELFQLFSWFNDKPVPDALTVWNDKNLMSEFKANSGLPSFSTIATVEYVPQHGYKAKGELKGQSFTTGSNGIYKESPNLKTFDNFLFPMAGSKKKFQKGDELELQRIDSLLTRLEAAQEARKKATKPAALADSTDFNRFWDLYDAWLLTAVSSLKEAKENKEQECILLGGKAPEEPFVYHNEAFDHPSADIPQPLHFRCLAPSAKTSKNLGNEDGIPELLQKPTLVEPAH
jgi:hypothetical protein